MNQLDATLPRGAVDAVLTVPEGADAPVQPDSRAQATFKRAARAEPAGTTLHLNAREAAWDLEARLPATVVSQLANLAHALRSHPTRPRTVALVSSGRREGTSTCIASLAAYFASGNARVLVVDANIHHPGLHTIAGVEQENGLAELIAGEIDLDRAIKPSGLPNLYVVTSGKRPAANGILLPSAFQERLLGRTGDFDFVLVDCPAVNIYQDAAVTAAACDAAVLVVEGGRTPRHAAQASKVLLTRSQCTVLGVFMNKRKFYIPKFLYERL